ncbi:MAG: helicase-associated domain-containing protein, partial [Myxococcota bacterium]
MSEDFNSSADGGANRKRRRRRRRRRDKKPESGADLLLITEDDRPASTSGDQAESGKGRGRRKGGRRSGGDMSGPNVSVPSSGRNPHRKRNSRARRSTPGSATARRRRLSRSEIDDLAGWLERMPEALVAGLYKGLGGQPGRVSGNDRMIQLAVRAIAQGSRLTSLLKSLHERDRKAVSALLQCGGIAHSEEFLRELMLSFGGHEREWKKTMSILAERGVVFSSGAANNEFFYVVPEPLIDGLVAALESDLALPTFDHDDVRIMESRPFCPPLDFTICSLATYIDQNHPRLTQRHEIYRHDKEEMDAFFGQLWETDSELFSFHLDFLMMHGMVELRGEYLALNSDVMEEWMRLEPEDQRDLIFRALDSRFDMAEWVLWAVHAGGGSWVPERPLAALYRRWKRGEDWRSRIQRGQTQATRTGDRDSYSFAPLVRSGILELGQWGQEKFYRLSPRGQHLLSPPEDDGFRQFYLTPAFEAMAPAGLAPVLLFRLGELAELTGCDRANTYRITDTSVERALSRGWRRDDVLQFLRDNSQIGLPDNVEQTLKGWIGHRGDVEFHDLTMLTVHRSQIRKVEG